MKFEKPPRKLKKKLKTISFASEFCYPAENFSWIIVRKAFKCLSKKHERLLKIFLRYGYVHFDRKEITKRNFVNLKNQILDLLNPEKLKKEISKIVKDDKSKTVKHAGLNPKYLKKDGDQMTVEERIEAYPEEIKFYKLS